MIHVKRFRAADSRGFSLVEMAVAVGILSIITMGSASIMTQAFKAQQKALSDVNLQTTIRSLAVSLQRKTVDGGGTAACKDILKFDTTLNTQFNEAGQTDMRLTPSSGEDYYATKTVNGPATFTIQKLYLDDVVLSTDLGTEKIYVASLYVRTKAGGGVVLQNRARNIATVTLTVNTADKSMQSCNVEPLTDSKAICDSMEGMKWNSGTGKCDQTTTLDTSTFSTQCMPGFRLQSGVCKPIATSCATGQLARGYNFSQVTACATPPVSVVAPIRAASTPVPEGATPPPVAAVAPVTYTTAPTSAPISAGAGSTPAATCSDGTSIGALTYDTCLDGSNFNTDFTGNGLKYTSNYCQPQLATLPPKAGTACVAQAAAPYSAPDLTQPAQQPSPQAPPLTCQCNSRLIGEGEYCMFCVDNVDYGFGDVDVAYGVSRCTAGNLVPDPSAQVDTNAPFTCANTYVRAKKLPSNKFMNYDEIP